MSEIVDPNQMVQALLIPLYIRAIESQRADALVKDEQAVALVQRMGYYFSPDMLTNIDEETRVAIVLRNREFDRYAWNFLARNPESVVVHVGCGLDSRFERVAERNSKVEWYDLDLPEVIELRRKIVGGEKERYHFLACSILDSTWIETISVYHQRPFLFLAEGVFMFLKEAEVKSLVLTLKENFPGAELIFDAFSPFFVWANNRRVARTKIGARCYWGLKRGQDLERWGDGVRFLDEWFPFEQPEPRLAHLRWVRHIPFLTRVMGIFHYRIGELICE